jgi:hypothetical protein
MTACGFGEKYWCQLVTGDSDGVVSTRQADVYSCIVAKCLALCNSWLSQQMRDWPRFWRPFPGRRCELQGQLDDGVGVVRVGALQKPNTLVFLSLIFSRHVSVLSLRGGNVIRLLALKYRGFSFRWQFITSSTHVSR